MKRIHYVVLNLMVIALVACTSELDEMNDNVHYQKALSGKELGANLMKSFQNVVSRSSDVKNLSYPSYYGGAYLNNEGQLVVNVVDAISEKVENDLTARCGGSGAVIEICKYSYSDLLSAAEKMDNYLLSEKAADNSLKFYGFSICDTENSIEIHLGDISESNIQNFKKEILEEPFLKFVKSEKPILQSEIMTGQSIVSGTGSYGSVGFRAKRSEGHVGPVTGFVTAGHVVQKAGTYVYEDASMSTPIGCADISQTSGDTDAAFCYTMNGYTFSNHLYSDSVSVNPTLSSYFINSKVAICGRHSASTGYITSTYTSSTFKWNSQGTSVSLTGIVEMTCISQSGDSGCIVYTPNDMNIAGTLIGGVKNSNLSYFMPASRTVEKYGLELY